MGCGCGKSSATPPLAKPAPPPPLAKLAPQPARLAPTPPGSFLLSVRGRLPQRFDSRLEAEAANVRQYAGRGVVVQA